MRTMIDSQIQAYGNVAVESLQKMIDDAMTELEKHENVDAYIDACNDEIQRKLQPQMQTRMLPASPEDSQEAPRVAPLQHDGSWLFAGPSSSL